MKSHGKIKSKKQYLDMYQRSISDLATFWEEQANHYIQWIKKWNNVLSGEFTNNGVKWFDDAQLNVCANCIDRQLPEKANQTAVIWEGDAPSRSKRKLSFNNTLTCTVQEMIPIMMLMRIIRLLAALMM